MVLSWSRTSHRAMERNSGRSGIFFWSWSKSGEARKPFRPTTVGLGGVPASPSCAKMILEYTLHGGLPSPLTNERVLGSGNKGSPDAPGTPWEGRHSGSHSLETVDTELALRTHLQFSGPAERPTRVLGAPPQCPRPELLSQGPDGGVWPRTGLASAERPPPIL